VAYVSNSVHNLNSGATNKIRLLCILHGATTDYWYTYRSEIMIQNEKRAPQSCQVVPASDRLHAFEL
jgi:hypothetical protein